MTRLPGDDCPTCENREELLAWLLLTVFNVIWISQAGAYYFHRLKLGIGF